MKKTVLLIVAVFALTMPSVYGQAKVGTTASIPFLRMSPSVRANGMGAAGVALQGAGGMYYNPALLGLFAIENRGALAFYPKEANGRTYWNLETPLDHQAVVLSLPRQWRPWPKVTLGVGYYRTRLHWGTAVETDWAHGEVGGTGNVYDIQDWAWHGLTSLAYDGPVKVAIGLTYKKITVDLGRYEFQTHAFDYGLAASMPLGRYLNFASSGGQLVVTPTVGISWANDGPDLEVHTNSYELPSVRRMGAAIELGFDRPEQIGHWRLISLIVTGESEKYLTDIHESRSKAGVELGLAEAVYLRAGHIDRDGSLTSQETQGFGVNSRGLLRLASKFIGTPSTKKTLEQMADFVSLEFSYAKSDADWLYSDDVSYYGLTLIF